MNRTGGNSGTTRKGKCYGKMLSKSGFIELEKKREVELCQDSGCAWGAGTEGRAVHSGQELSRVLTQTHLLAAHLTLTLGNSRISKLSLRDSPVFMMMLQKT